MNRKHEILIFTKWLASLLAANIPMTHALEMAEKNIQKPALKKIVHHINIQVNAGKPLSEACKAYPDYFDDLFCNLIQAGEHAGTLEVILKNIAQYYENEIRFKRTLKKALIYPITVLIIAVAITIALLVFIVPQFSELFQNVGAELPPLTQMIVTLSERLQKNILSIFVGCVLILILIKKWVLRSEKCLTILDHASLHVPIFGEILKQSTLSRTLHTLSLLLRVGIPLTDALKLTANVAHNRVYKTVFFDMTQKIISGHSVYAAAQSTHALPDTVTQVIALGESTGTLDHMLQKLSEHFEENIAYLSHNIGQLIEPIIMIFLCFVVGTIIVAMYLPIFKIGTLI